MGRRIIVKWVAIPVLAAVALQLAGFAIFVPSPREPAYTFVTSWGEPGKAPDVAEYFNDRVQVFALDGTPRRTIGEPGGGPGQFNAPGGVAVTDTAGNSVTEQ